MKKSSNTKRAFLASILSLLLCMVMLIGSTFAWFTDTVTSGKNVITAGNLKIAATYQDVEKDPADGAVKYTIPGFTRAESFSFKEEKVDINEENAIIDEELWEPGAVGAKLITVSNIGNLAAKVKLVFSVEDGGLQSALWFDLVQVDGAGTVTGSFTKREMSTLTMFGSNVEIPLMPEGTDGDSVSFILLYGMAEEAGNEYMNTSFSADVTILATQYTYEEDSFGPDYDKDATYPVTSTADLKTALSNGGIAVLANDVSVKPEGEDDGLVPQMKVTEDTILDISGYTLGVAYSEVDDFSYTPALISVDSGTLTIDGDGVITAEAGNNNSYGIDVNGGDLVINGGSYYGALTAIQVTQGSLIINDGFFDLAPTCKAAVPVSYAKYVVNAIDRYYKDGTAVIEIKGGTFVNFDPSANPEGDGTSYVADGYKVVSETQTNGEIWYTVVAE